MGTGRAARNIDAQVTSHDVAANLRVLTVRFEDSKLEEQGVRDALGRIDQIVALFLEKHWMHPRRFDRLQPLSYVLFQGPDDTSFEEDAAQLRGLLERHLFGEGVFSGVEVKCLVGDACEVEGIARGPEDAFRDVHERAQAAAAREAEAREAGDSGSDDDSLIIDDAAPGLRAASALWTERLRLFAGYDARRSAILSYVTTLAVGSDPVVPLQYGEFGRSTGVSNAAFEFQALRYAVTTLLDQSRSGPVCNCLTPLSYETLASRRNREAYLALSEKTPESIRRYIVPTVFGGPTGPSSSFLMELVSAVSTVFSAVNWQTPTCAVDPEPFKHAGVIGLTLVLPQNGAEREIELARLPQLVRRLTLLRLSSGVAGLADRAEVDAAMASGVRYLSGRGVSNALTQLAPRMNVTPDDLPIT